MVKLRPAIMGDWARLYAWRAHPTTRAQMKEQGEVPLDGHIKWLKHALTDKAIHLFVAYDPDRGSAPIGQVRLDVTDAKKKAAEVSITVDPGHRGKGYAEQILANAELQAAMLGLRTLRAVIRVDNYASLRAFAEISFAVETVTDQFVTLKRELPK